MEENNIEKTETTPSNEMKNTITSKSKIIIFSTIAILIIVGSIFIYQTTQASKQQEYGKELNNVVLDMISTSAESEIVLNTYSKVWDTSIRSKIGNGIFYVSWKNLLPISDDECYDYFWGKEVEEGDFDTALNITIEYFSKEGVIESIKNNRSQISDKMRELNNPPEKYKEAYETAVALYNSYEAYTGLAVSPRGSLASFNQEIRKLSSDIIAKSKEYKIRFPVEK